MSTNKEQNFDFMAWNSPGSSGPGSGPNQGSGGSSQGSDNQGRGSGGWGYGPAENNNDNNKQDPWGRTMRRQPSFDESLKNFFKKLFKGGMGSGSGSGRSRAKGFGSVSLILVIAVLLGFYIFSGFYTVREAERGVVLRFGKVYDVVEPGLAWKFTGIDQVFIVDIEQVRAIQSSGSMLTEDENLVIVEMDVQYRISDPVRYLFSVTDPDNSLMEATDSALRYVVGHTLMDDILTSGREMVRQNTRDLLVSIIEPYNMGLSVVDVNFLPARAPEQVKAAFDDAIAAQEDEQRFVREAEAYANEVLPRADGQVQRIRQEAEAYRSRVVLDAQGQVSRFEQILPEYLKAPEITRTRIYLETMQEVLSKSSKVIVNTKDANNPLMYLPLPQLAPNAAPTAAQLSQASVPAAETEQALDTGSAGTNAGTADSSTQNSRNSIPLLPNTNYQSRGAR